jgi:hypothetical protein
LAKNGVIYTMACALSVEEGSLYEGEGAHKIIGAIWPILKVLFGVLFEVLMEYSTQ